jgi:uncharacterized membrane protein YraQ (UPF0718 family)
MNFLEKFGQALWALSLDSAPSLIFGLVLAGLLVTLLPTSRLASWLSGKGAGPIFKAALIGVPLPLCSCSVVPVAMGLRRSGASRGSTLAFLISTPENGPDAIFLSYTLLGPVLAFFRIVSAAVSAVITGLLAGNGEDSPPPAPAPTSCCKCSCSSSKPAEAPKSFFTRVVDGLKYAATDIFDDLLPWLLVGLVAAAAIQAALPAGSLAAWGSGLGAKLAMVAIGVPMYICASASTPVAASLLALGISPGTVLVFLLAGPATNLGTVGLVRKEMGNQALRAYLVGAAVVPIFCGLVLDALPVEIRSFGLPQTCGCEHPSVFSILSLVLLLGLAIRPLRNLLLGVDKK